jgi:hypothetical protein
MHRMSNEVLKFLAFLRAEYNTDGGLVTKFYKGIDETGRINVEVSVDISGSFW